jgi:hypothetical protein
MSHKPNSLSPLNIFKKIKIDVCSLANIETIYAIEHVSSYKLKNVYCDSVSYHHYASKSDTLH